MKAPFLVYELEQDQPSWGRRDRWSSCEADPGLPVRLNANVIGCFIAESPAEACSDAAKVEKRAGNFLAVRGDLYKIDFSPTQADEQELEKLGTQPKKHPFYCCYGHLFCEKHPRGSDDPDDDDGSDATPNLRREPNATEGVAGPAATRTRKQRKRKE